MQIWRWQQKAGQNFHFSTLRSTTRARVFAYVIVVTVACKFEIEKKCRVTPPHRACLCDRRQTL